MRRFWFPKFIGIAALAILAIFVFSYFVMYLWNETLPFLFHVPAISQRQSLELLVLCRLLFGGLRGPWGGRPRWRNRMQQRWMNMTPEEKLKFQERWGNRCGPQF